MKVSAAALDEVDRLTEADLPLLDSDEWCDIKRRRDFIRDASAETRSIVRVKVNKAFTVNDADDETDDDAPDGDIPEEETSLQRDEGWNLVYQFEYMFDDWNIYDPPDAEGNRKPWKKTRENREKFVRIHGAALWAQMAIRGGAIVPTAKLKGKVDPDSGTPLTFQENVGDGAR